jgi:phage terminase small subunit
MRDLTDMQRQFVIAYFDSGGRSPQLAAKIAGYQGGDAACAQRGYELTRNPKVLRAMREEAERRFGSSLVTATVALEGILLNPNHKDHYKAITRTLDQNGMIVQTQHRVVVEDNRTPAEVIERIRKYALDVGLDPAKVLKSNGIVIDAEFTEVAAPSQVNSAAPSQVNDAVEDFFADNAND